MRHAARTRPAILWWCGCVLGLGMAFGGSWSLYEQYFPPKVQFEAAGVLPIERTPTAAPMAPSSPSTVATAGTLSPTKPSPKPTVQLINPTRLTIAAIGVDNPVIPIEVHDGALIPPPDPNVMGWWVGGAKPGTAKGSVALTAHVDSQTLGKGVLQELKNTPIGAEITVAGSPGQTPVQYVVQARRSYLKQELPLDLVFGQTGPAQLVIITCGGSYNRDEGGYSDNIVVFATPKD